MASFSLLSSQPRLYYPEHGRKAGLLLLELDNMRMVCLERSQKKALDFLYRKARQQLKLHYEINRFYGNLDWFNRIQETYSYAVSYLSMIRSPKRRRGIDMEMDYHTVSELNFSWIPKWIRDYMDKTPAAAGSLACGIDSSESMLASAPYPHEGNILNSPLDDCSNPCSNDAQGITSSDKTAHAPMLHELSNTKLQYEREIDSSTGYDMLQANKVNMIKFTLYWTVPHEILLDSAAPDHHSGYNFWFRDRRENQKVKVYISGVGGGKAEIKGRGSICDANFQVKAVNYTPGLNTIGTNNEITTYKTIFSVDKLILEKCDVKFSVDGSVIVYRGTHPWMPWKSKIVGKGRADGRGYYLMDYLKITDDEPTLWKPACSVWNTIRRSFRDRSQDMVLPR